MDAKKLTKLFREIPVWRKLSESRAVRYNCLEDIENRKFVVQSADFFSLPIKDTLHAYFSKQFVELFIQIDPEDRKIWSSSLEVAVALHEDQFKDVDLWAKPEESEKK